MTKMVNTDTIAAIATAPGMGGVGIIRISGSQALELLNRLFQPGAKNFKGFQPRTLHYGRIVDSGGSLLDDGLVVHFPAPHSFTGEDVVELQTHGGSALLQTILEQILDYGVRQAEKGEFTRRAFLNSRMDLTQAEAVAELIAAPGPEGIRLASAKLDGMLGQKIVALRDRLEYARQRLCLAIDFPEEEGECLPPAEFQALVDEVSGEVEQLIAAYERVRCWQEGALIVLMGRVNAGKSSLMNALLGRPRAIVTELPGTTRDYLEEQTKLNGLPIRLADTAGLRDYTDDPIEQEGMRRSLELAAQAQAVLIVMDGSLLADHDPVQLKAAFDTVYAEEKELLQSLGPERCILVWNKMDLMPLPPGMDTIWGIPLVAVCARQGMGLEPLAAKVRALCGAGAPVEGELAPNMRQTRMLRQAVNDLYLLRAAISSSMPPDVCSVHLEGAATSLAGITGLNTSEETLNAIFEEFCIGK